MAVLKNVVSGTNGLTEAILGTRSTLDARMAVVSYSGNKSDGTYNDAWAEQVWTDSKATIDNSVKSISAYGGTNWEAGLRTGAELLGKCRSDAQKIVVFLSDGEVPIDNLASERALRTFTIGRKNWMTINTVRGADASATIYSVTETARANGLNVYYYMEHLLTELTQIVRADGSIDEKELEPLMPWSKDLPAECYKRRK